MTEWEVVLEAFSPDALFFFLYKACLQAHSFNLFYRPLQQMLGPKYNCRLSFTSRFADDSTGGVSEARLRLQPFIQSKHRTQNVLRDHMLLLSLDYFRRPAEWKHFIPQHRI